MIKQPRSRRKVWSSSYAIGALLIVALASIGLFVLAARNSPTSSAHQDAAPQLPVEKQKDVATEERWRRQAADVPKDQMKREFPDRKGKPLVDSDWPTGIFDDAEWVSSEYRFNNRWTGVHRGQHLNVLAGTYGSDPSRGLILVQYISFNLNHEQHETFPAPDEVGALKVESVDDFVVTLSSASGHTLRFDIRKMRYL